MVDDDYAVSLSLSTGFVEWLIPFQLPILALVLYYVDTYVHVGCMLY